MKNPSAYKSLKVQDAEEMKSFLTNARQTWRKHHPEKVRLRGRPSSREIVTAAAFDAWIEDQLSGKSSLGQFARVIKKRLGTDAPTDETVRKHVKSSRYREGLRQIDEGNETITKDGKTYKMKDLMDEVKRRLKARLKASSTP